MIGLLLVATSLIPRPGVLAGWGAEVLHRIEKQQFAADTGVFSERGEPADLATEAHLISALSAAADYDAKMLPTLRRAIAGLSAYSSDADGFAEHPKGAERSYADNALLALALQDAARADKNGAGAVLAHRALAFALSGLDKAAGGVKESDLPKSPLTLAATARTALAVLRQADLSTPKDAEDMYNWVRTNLRDSATNLLLPTMGATTPSPADTSTMIELAAGLFAATRDERFAEQARRLEALSVGRWVDDSRMSGADTVGGAALVESWFDRIRLCPRRLETFGSTMDGVNCLVQLHDFGRDRADHYGRQFGIAPAKDETPRLIDDAAAARAFYMSAYAMQGHH